MEDYTLYKADLLSLIEKLENCDDYQEFRKIINTTCDTFGNYLFYLECTKPWWLQFLVDE